MWAGILDKSFDLWRERNRFEWDLDLSIITNSGINLSKEFNKTERKDFSETKTSYIRTIEKNNSLDLKHSKNITINLEKTEIIQLNQKISQDEKTNENLFTNSVCSIKDVSNIDECVKYKSNNLIDNNGLINKIRSYPKYMGTIWHYMLICVLNIFSKRGNRHD